MTAIDSLARCVAIAERFAPRGASAARSSRWGKARATEPSTHCEGVVDGVDELVDGRAGLDHARTTGGHPACREAAAGQRHHARRASGSREGMRAPAQLTVVGDRPTDHDHRRIRAFDIVPFDGREQAATARNFDDVIAGDREHRGHAVTLHGIGIDEEDAWSFVGHALRGAGIAPPHARAHRACRFACGSTRCCSASSVSRRRRIDDLSRPAERIVAGTRRRALLRKRTAARAHALRTVDARPTGQAYTTSVVRPPKNVVASRNTTSPPNAS